MTKTISKANGNSQVEIKQAMRLALRDAIKQADAQVKATGKEAVISTGISFNFGGR
jgi:hypothetical protein